MYHLQKKCTSSDFKDHDDLLLILGTVCDSSVIVVIFPQSLRNFSEQCVLIVSSS